jgi:hypothetical protein
MECVTLTHPPPTHVPAFKKELRWNDLYYHVAKGL